MLTRFLGNKIILTGEDAMVNIEKMIEGVSEQISTKLKGMMRKYKNGEITEEHVYSSIKRELETFVNTVRPTRNREGQILAVGIFGPIQLQMLKGAIEEEFGKFTEFQQKSLPQGSIRVQITVLAAGAELFRASLKDGMLHQREWDKFLTIS